jgi:hypothetical protein
LNVKLAGASRDQKVKVVPLCVMEEYKGNDIIMFNSRSN